MKHCWFACSRCPYLWSPSSWFCGGSEVCERRDAWSLKGRLVQNWHKPGFVLSFLGGRRIMVLTSWFHHLLLFFFSQSMFACVIFMVCECVFPDVVILLVWSPRGDKSWKLHHVFFFFFFPLFTVSFGLTNRLIIIIILYFIQMFVLLF